MPCGVSSGDSLDHRRLQPVCVNTLCFRQRAVKHRVSVKIRISSLERTLNPQGMRIGRDAAHERDLMPPAKQRFRARCGMRQTARVFTLALLAAAVPCRRALSGGHDVVRCLPVLHLRTDQRAGRAKLAASHGKARHPLGNAHDGVQAAIAVRECIERVRI